MIKKINDFLAGWPMTLVGGVFLLASFILPRTGRPWGENLAWVCVVICGIPLLYLAVWRIIYNRGISKISSALLISMAMIAALCIGDLFAAGEVAFIMEIGALLEEMTTDRAKKGLKNLISLAPDTGRIIRDGKETIVPGSEIKKGDIVRILPGETIPVDGSILAGETSVDQSVMTGESLPVDKTIGDTVFSGTINRFGSIDIEATKVGEDSSLQKLIRMMEDAEKNQAPTQRIADRWASWLVPFALLIAIVAYIVTEDIVRAVTVLVVFCPCALVLATPTAIIAAIGQAAKHGVIIKSGEALEKMGKVDTIAFDKTGTLTYGKLQVSDIIPFGELSENKLLILTAAAESRSEHPLGKAIYEKAASIGMAFPQIEDFRMEAGKGIS
ncbi:MAG: cation-translocating P-type ATPase, partial [Acidaminococcaceae bacterium]|nr:cation-translocating P-type ATPase [Acidaminococcaceae bacterium]